MKAAFWLGVLFGFGGLLAAAHYWPWFAHPRLPSQTSVVANGGRAETFLIRLPADRVAALAAGENGLRAGDALAAPLDVAGEDGVLVEHFKLRDSAGNVIGIAARHWSSTPGGRGTAWSLLIPSRGALFMRAAGEAQSALDAALRAAGRTQGASWEGSVKVALGSGAPGVVTAGSEEFEGMTGRYGEVWDVTGVDDGGELRGTIELATVTFRGS